MSDFVSLNTALSALRAARLRMDTASHNIANVATSGYTRQRTDLQPSPSWDSAEGPVGSGVDVTGISRARDRFLDARVRSGSAQLGESSVRADVLERMERMLGEPDNGLSSRIDDVFAAFDDLSLDPSSAGARAATLGALEELAARVRGVASSWDALAADSAAQVRTLVGDLNKKLREVATLNAEIVANPGANDLADRRDLLIDELARIAGATATIADDGTARVSIGGLAVVDHTMVSSLIVQPDGTVLHPSGVALPAGGEIGGYRAFLASDLPAMRAALDSLVADFAGALNAQHQAGWVDATTTGGALLAYSPANAAATLRVAITDPSLLAVSDAPGPPFPVGNGRNAAAIAGLRTQSLATGGTQTVGAATRSLAARLGSAVASAIRLADASHQQLSASEGARSAVHGVSLDEEMSALVEAQHAFNAAARVMTAVDEAIDTLVNRMGIVGR